MKKILLIGLLSILTTATFAQDSLSVLFIGNSYTAVNNLPDMTRQLAESLGKELTIGSKTNGGFTFQAHWNDPQTYTAMHQRDWDVVVLQAQSQEPSFSVQQVATNTLPYAHNLADSIVAASPCADILYFMTWGRQNGDPQWDSINTFDKMNARLYNTYMNFAEETGGMVSPVGAAWKYIRDNHPAIQLYSADGSHPSLEGSYLAACTFYAALFQSPTNGAAYVAGLNTQTAAILQQAADHVVLDSLDHFMLHPVGQHLVANFSYQDNNLEVAFTNTSANASSYAWDFGDGNQSTDNSPTHAYANAGTYTVTLIATNNCSSDTITIPVIVGTNGISTLQQSGLTILEYDDHFSVVAAKPLYYEIYSFDGKKVSFGKILTSEPEMIKKVINYGFLFIKDEAGVIYQKNYRSIRK